MLKLLAALLLIGGCSDGADKGKHGDIEPFATGLVVPRDWDEHAKFEPVASPTTAPTDFSLSNLPPIKNQGSCGSCWAFSVTAVLEYLEYGVTGEYKDLAEQTLVSSCSNSGSCRGGFFTAFDFLGKSGLPAESSDPYRARNSSCNQGTKKISKISRWAYVGERGREPTVDEIKAAIMTYGLVSVTVAANGSLKAHRGPEVYRACNSGRVNHMVTLSGWRSDSGQTVWRMRNSWGTGWGDKGEAWILAERNGRKCNAIGETTAFAVYNFDLKD